MDYETGIRLDRIENLLNYLVSEYEKGKEKTNPKKKKDKKEEVK